jgi:hypothetical protein
VSIGNDGKEIAEKTIYRGWRDGFVYLLEVGKLHTSALRDVAMIYTNGHVVVTVLCLDAVKLRG